LRVVSFVVRHYIYPRGFSSWFDWVDKNNAPIPLGGFTPLLHWIKSNNHARPMVLVVFDLNPQVPSINITIDAKDSQAHRPVNIVVRRPLTFKRLPYSTCSGLWHLLNLERHAIPNWAVERFL
jgi:hypothetical protein